MILFLGLNIRPGPEARALWSTYSVQTNYLHKEIFILSLREKKSIASTKKEGLPFQKRGRQAASTGCFAFARSGLFGQGRSSLVRYAPTEKSIGILNVLVTEH